jgi:hypothetical protein
MNVSFSPTESNMPAAQHPDHHGILRYFLSGVYLAPDAVCKQAARPAPAAPYRT